MLNIEGYPWLQKAPWRNTDFDQIIMEINVYLPKYMMSDRKQISGAIGKDLRGRVAFTGLWAVGQEREIWVLSSSCSADVTLLRLLPISISEILRRWHFALPPTNLWLAILISASCPCVSSVEITVCWGGVGGAKVLKSLFSGGGGGGVLRGITSAKFWFL